MQFNFNLQIIPCIPLMELMSVQINIFAPLVSPLSFLFATLKSNIPTLPPYPSPSRLFLCYVWILLIDAHASLAAL